MNGVLVFVCDYSQFPNLPTMIRPSLYIATVYYICNIYNE